MPLWDGVPYEYAAVTGHLVFTAGACPLDETGRVVAPGDLEAQAEQAVANLLEALAERGVGSAGIAKTTVYVVAGERSDLVRMVGGRLGTARPRAEHALGVSLLGYPDQLVEIEAVAAAPRSDAG